MMPHKLDYLLFDREMYKLNVIPHNLDNGAAKADQIQWRGHSRCVADSYY